MKIDDLKDIKSIALRIIEKDGKRELGFEIGTGKEGIVLYQTSVEVEAFLKDCRVILKDYLKNVKTFVVNDYITLKLENNQTKIYVNGKYFNQCKYLLLNIPTEDIRELGDIKSIDHASERLDKSLHGRSDRLKKFKISPEQEFEGHCSNIQAWFENSYDTRLMHRNLAFPLLQQLTKGGDPLARKLYKDEIALRIEAGEENVFRYLMNGGYLKPFNNEELLLIAENMKESNTKLMMLEYLNRRGVEEVSPLFKEQLIEKVIKDDPEIYKFLNKYGSSLTDKEREELSKKTKNPIIRILLLSKEITDKFPEFVSFSLDEKNDIISSKEKEFHILKLNNEFAPIVTYKDPISIYDKIPCKFVGNKRFLDFGIKTNNRKLVYPFKYIQLAKELMNQNKDIQITFPLGNGPLKISSKSENMEIYIEPIFFY